MPFVGYGGSPYGLSPYGAVAPISILECYPLGPRRIYVRFNTAPQARSPISVGDVQNRRTWDLTRLDTGVRSEVVGAKQLKTDMEWMLVLLSPIGPSVVQHRLSGVRLRSAGGLPAVAPSTSTFLGVDADPKLFGDRTRDLVVDLRNDNLFGAGQALTPDSSGNYRLQAGVSGWKKRVLRMLSTNPGAWPSDATFGLGITCGELATDTLSWKKRIEDMIRKDPETAAVGVSISVLDSGIVNIFVRARLVTGAEVPATFIVNGETVTLG